MSDEEEQRYGSNEEDEEMLENGEGEDEDDSDMEAYRQSTKLDAPVINDVERMLEKTREMQLKIPGVNKITWVETLMLAPNRSLALPEDKVHDDLARELSFHDQTVSAVKEGFRRFKQLGITYQRPDDYFAEMVKTDEHMKRVKENILLEQKKITAVEERIKTKELKKVAKQVQVEKTQAKQKEKRANLDAVKQWREERENSGSKNDDEAEPSFLRDNRVKAGDKRKRDDSTGPRASKKRKGKDAKYGYGGGKKNAKRNDSKSSNDMRGFSLGKNKSPVGGMGQKGKKGGPGGGKAAGGKRPGKFARTKAHAQKGSKKH
eukprot:GILK01003499.1.p1 GENE.GILK01003499.1~~GILK01003499.1.p1  ORF type:complete len:319 (-),score=83.80 GILK01003499.1:208-1164(-)